MIPDTTKRALAEAILREGRRYGLSTSQAENIVAKVQAVLDTMPVTGAEVYEAARAATITSSSGGGVVAGIEIKAGEFGTPAAELVAKEAAVAPATVLAPTPAPAPVPSPAPTAGGEERVWVHEKLSGESRLLPRAIVQKRVDRGETFKVMTEDKTSGWVLPAALGFKPIKGDADPDAPPPAL